MTSLTTIFGLLPLAFAMGEGSELRAPMARTVMGGLTTAAFLTLFVVPCIYIVLETVKEHFVSAFVPVKGTGQGDAPRSKKIIIEEIDVSGPRPRRKTKKPSPEQEETREEPALEPEEPPPSETEKDLTPRQMQALDHIRISGKITRLEYVVKFKVPLPVADRELEELVEKNILQASGEGPHRLYSIKEEKKED
jgi:hypothetical protein